MMKETITGVSVAIMKTMLGVVCAMLCTTKDGAIAFCVLTENLAKVSKLLGDGEWGDNRPERRIGQRLLMSVEEKNEVKGEMRITFNGREYMSSGSYKQVDILCPFYRYDDGKRRVVCEGLCDDGSITQLFHHRDDYEALVQKKCCDDFKNCEIYKLLIAVKYRAK